MIREINIQPVLNGFLCNVGCQRVVFEGREKMLAELKKYLEDPDGTEHQFIKNAVNRMEPPSVPAMPTPHRREPIPECSATETRYRVDTTQVDPSGAGQR